MTQPASENYGRQKKLIYGRRLSFSFLDFALTPELIILANATKMAITPELIYKKIFDCFNPYSMCGPIACQHRTIYNLYKYFLCVTINNA